MSGMTINNGVPEAASVGELCQMLSLSKRRFYELQKQGVFPGPSAYTLTSRRPIFLADDIRACLEVRRRNVGLNGQITLFYAARLARPERPSQPAARLAQRSSRRGANGATRAAAPQPSQHAEIIDALAALGIDATAAQVAAAIRETFPAGIVGVDQGDAIRRLYQHIRARNSADNAGR